MNVVIQQEERRMANVDVSRAAKRVMDAKEAKKQAKEMLDRFLNADEEYRGLVEYAKDARQEQKTAKQKLVTESEEGQALWKKYEETSENLKGVEDHLSTVLEAQFVATGKFNFDVDGENIVINRKFNLSARQMKLF